MLFQKHRFLYVKIEYGHYQYERYADGRDQDECTLEGRSGVTQVGVTKISKDLFRIDPLRKLSFILGPLKLDALFS